MKKLRIDYHFHPNLPGNEKKALNKAKKWWRQFEKKNINCVIVTEHDYCQPQKTFELINKTKPKDCFCFPGLEYVTKEGIDIVIFGENPDIYKIPALQPFELTFEQTIDLVLNDEKLFAFVTHPYTMGLPSILRKLGHDRYMHYVNKLGAVEILYCVYDNYELLLKKLPLRLMFKSLLKRIEFIKNLPKSDYPKKIKFLAAGSDAHHILEVGNCYEINLPEKIYDRKKIFEIITNNQGQGKAFIRKVKFNFPLLLVTWGIREKEWVIKEITKLKTKLFS